MRAAQELYPPAGHREDAAVRLCGGPRHRRRGPVLRHRHRGRPPSTGAPAREQGGVGADTPSGGHADGREEARERDGGYGRTVVRGRDAELRAGGGRSGHVHRHRHPAGHHAVLRPGVQSPGTAEGVGIVTRQDIMRYFAREYKALEQQKAEG